MLNEKEIWLEETLKTCKEASELLEKVRKELIEKVESNWHYLEKLSLSKEYLK